MASFLLIFFSIFYFSSPLILAADDTLKFGETLLINQTLISTSRIFALGFFSFGKFPTRHYLGIWYVADPSAIVWVANRENPVTDDNSAFFAFTSKGNVGIFRANRSLVWSSNATEVSNATEAIMLDTGDFVLSLNGNYIWESFDNPTDTAVPTMKIRSYYKQGIAPRYTCWAAEDDPKPGQTSVGFDTRSSLQIKVWNGSKTLWRADLMNKTSLDAGKLRNGADIYVLQVMSDDKGVYWSFSVTSSKLTRGIVAESGIELLSWDQSSSSWNKLLSLPVTDRKSCNVYNICGPNGVCNEAGNYSPMCKCFEGYRPQNATEWNVGNYSSGCVKEMVWECGKEGSFIQYSRLKVPDNMVLVKDVGEGDCKANCTASCNCTAYLFDDAQTLDSKTRCLVWYGDMIDLVQYLSATEKINVRVAASDIPGDSHKKSSNLDVILLPILATSILILATMAYCLRIRYKKIGNIKRLSHRNASNSGEISKGLADVPYVEFSEVLDATDNFFVENKIGEGGFGPVYKGKLQNGQEVAIKRLSKGSRQGCEEFRNEVELIAKLQHTNLVKLLGWCNEHDEKILIYEYVPYGSLDKYLFDKVLSLNLNWEKRWQIIEGIAQGILYLHRYSRLRVIHRDLKTSNILLDDKMNAKISDFGLARIFDGNQVEANTQRVVGTYGYMSPEYAIHGIFSDKSDVFSFGVMLLEIVSGKRNTSSHLYKHALNLLGHVWQLWVEERCFELADPSLENSFSALQMMRCIHVGLLCVQERPTDRPTMSSIVYMLGNENAILPTPEKPSFVALNDVISYASYSEDTQNEITLTSVEAR